MKNTSKTLIFFGNERLSTGFRPNGAPTLQALLENGYTVKAVVSHFTIGTSRTARHLEVEEVAKAHNIPVLLPEKPTEVKEALIEYDADAAVLIAYGKIIPQSLIDIFPHGIVNIHPSLLPRYRGSTPIEQTILNGDDVAGVSLMQLVKEMDAGPVYAQRSLPLTGNETKHELTHRLLKLGSELLIENLPDILSGQLQPRPQNNKEATYTALLTKEDGVLDTSQTAVELERKIRAFEGWPKSRITLFEKPIIVKEAEVVTSNNQHDLILECANQSLLRLKTVIAPSGKTMSGEAFLRGLRH